MQQGDFDAFSEMLSAVGEYCGKPLSPAVIAIYWQGLSDLDIDAFRAALNAHVQNPDTGQFMPKIADIRRMIGGTTRDASLVAWNKVQAAVGRAGAYLSVCFDDPIINRVLIEMGGWPAHCAKQEDELPFVERNFCDRYRAYASRGGVQQFPGYLVGLIEGNNALLGFKPEPPVLIGNSDAAQRVLAAGSDSAMVAITAVTSAVASVKQLEDRRAA